jgi:hypothetical protein
MVEIPDFRSRFQFQDLPFSGAFPKAHTCAYFADEIDLRAKRLRSEYCAG